MCSRAYENVSGVDDIVNKKIDKYDHNKPWTYIIVFFKDIFKGFIDYTTELRFRTSLWRFLLQKWIIIAIVLVLPIIMLIATFFLCESKYDVNLEGSIFSVTVFDLVSGLVIYTGSTFLAVTLYYSSWKQDRLRENDNAIVVHYETGLDSNGNSVFDESEVVEWSKINTKKMGYINIEITNQNYITPVKVKFSNVYMINKSSVEGVQHRTIIMNDERRFLAYGETGDYYVGFEDKLFDNDIKLIFIFTISNLKDHNVKLVYFCPTYGRYCDGYGILIETSKYNELVDKYGLDFLKEVVFSIKSKKRYYNRVSLYK